MVEGEDRGVQGLAAERVERRPRRRRQEARLGLETRPVDRIAEQRMADMGEMDADLVGASGLQPAGDEARRAERFLDAASG